MNRPPKLEDALRPDGAPKIVFEYGHQGFLNAVATEFPVIETADLDFLEIAEQATRPAPLAIVIFNEPIIERSGLFERLWLLAHVVVEAIDGEHCRVRKSGAFDDGVQVEMNIAPAQGERLH